MMMELKLVTFEIDNTQFLVNATGLTEHEIIEYANDANKELSEIEDYDFEEYLESDYEVEDVGWDMLKGIFRRTDRLFETADVIVFND